MSEQETCPQCHLSEFGASEARRALADKDTDPILRRLVQDLDRQLAAEREKSERLQGTVVSGCHTPGCCGCMRLTYVPDEDAYMAICNECSEKVGWFKESWNNSEDRERLGRDVPA